MVTTTVSGDGWAMSVLPALGIRVANRYQGDYWPARIERIGDEETLCFVEELLYLVPLGPREKGYDPLHGRQLTSAGAKALALAAKACCLALRARDRRAFGAAVRRSFEAQVRLFPSMLTPSAEDAIARHQSALGWKLSGAGGGGYLVVVSDTPIARAVRICVRRGHD
jgi:hypothetical protein